MYLLTILRYYFENVCKKYIKRKDKKGDKAKIRTQQSIKLPSCCLLFLYLNGSGMKPPTLNPRTPHRDYRIVSPNKVGMKINKFISK